MTTAKSLELRRKYTIWHCIYGKNNMGFDGIVYRITLPPVHALFLLAGLKNAGKTLLEVETHPSQANGILIRKQCYQTDDITPEQLPRGIAFNIQQAEAIPAFTLSHMKRLIF